MESFEEEYYTGARVNGETRPEYHWVVKSDIYNEEQLAYIDHYMQDVYDAIYGSRTQSVVENLVDIDSFVPLFWSNPYMRKFM